jgi:cardiolipin synthase A/B
LSHTTSKHRTALFLTKRWWHIPLWTWFLAFVFFLAGVVVYSFFFAHRAEIEFRPAHTFKVSDPEFFGSAHALGDPMPVHGNRITLLHNGDQIFPAMLAAIRDAKLSVNFEAFLFHSGTVGSQFRDAFIERARAGVRVRVLFDGIGSGSSLDNSDIDLMRQAGCHVEYYHPTRSWRLDRINRRSHRRVLVVDGKVGFTGGVGFSDEWQGNADSPDHWREVHAKLEGPVVAKLQGAFQQHWVRSTGEALSGAHEFPELKPVGDLRAQVIASHSFSVAALPLLQAVAISAANRRVCITNAYCTPNDDQVELLIAAVKRGVSVELLLPGKHHDQPATKAAGRTAYGKLLEGGVKIFEYQPTMIHSKTMVVDGLFSLIGTSNLDSRSAFINEEIDVSVYDADFGREMETVFDTDLKNARPYTLQDFKSRGPWERASEALTQPFRSQL